MGDVGRNDSIVMKQRGFANRSRSWRSRRIQGIQSGFFVGTSRDQRGITGLETAIVLIAFVVVASVFAFAVLSTGLLSSEKAKETVAGGVSEVQTTMVLRGSVIGRSTSTPGTFERITFQVGTAAGSTESVDLSSTGVVVTYIDDNQLANLAFDAGADASPANPGWTTNFISGSGDNLDPGEAAEIIVNLTGLSPLLGGNKNFRLQIKPLVGARLDISKRTPAEIKEVTFLD